MPRGPTCPVCGKPALTRRQNRSFPFCSDRCRLVDLGKWLGEEYRVAGARQGDGGSPAVGADDPDAGPEDA